MCVYRRRARSPAVDSTAPPDSIATASSSQPRRICASPPGPLPVFGAAMAPVRGVASAASTVLARTGVLVGATVADVGVLIGNDRAQAAYEKAGFRVVMQKLDAAFEAAYGCTGIRGLSRPI